MNEFEFTLKFTIPDDAADRDTFVERLYESGCDDALIGVGQPGRLALQFNRHANTAMDALKSAILDIRKVFPDAKLTEANPDLVGLTDLAQLLGFSRQNMRKLMLTHETSFPSPLHDGRVKLWHLDNILGWFDSKQARTIDPSLLDVARITRQFNLARENQARDPGVSREILKLGI